MQLERPDAWRCTSCGALMYNRDAKGYPAPGAPMSHFYSLEQNEVCSMCYSMVLPLCTQAYWMAAQDAEAAEIAKRKENNERLTGRRDYFTGT